MSNSNEVPGIGEVLRAHRGEQHVVVLHDFPDPDAISSAFAHRLISAQFEIDVDILYGGRISHQENIALVKLLGINLARYEKDVELAYDGVVLVDNQGTTNEAVIQALEAAGIPVLIVVDHHAAQGRVTAEFSDVRRVGATATIYASYLQQDLVEMDKAHREHVLAATALMHGILTDTNAFARAFAQDFEAAAFLSRFRDADLLDQIMNQSRSKQTMQIIRQALGDRVTVENYSIAGIGYLRSEDRDAIPQAADFLLTEENVHTAVVYGIVVGDDQEETLVGSMRTSKLTIDPDEFIKDVMGKDVCGQYFGGGRPMAGGFEISLGFLVGGRGEEHIERKWRVYDTHVKQKVFAKIGVERETDSGQKEK